MAMRISGVPEPLRRLRDAVARGRDAVARGRDAMARGRDSMAHGRDAVAHGRDAIARFSGALLDAALPPHCLTCEAAVSDHGTFCAGCFGGLSFITTPLCEGCGLPMPFAGPRGEMGRCEACLARPHAFTQARAAWLYDEAARRLILPFKHGDRTALAGPIARHMARAGAALLAQADLLVPVPLHPSRLRTRGYNQSALLARHLAKGTGRPWLPDTLRRIRATTSLGEMGAAQRRVAVAGAFTVAPRHTPRLTGRRILLIDDVLTSGATADACAEALLAAGATAVDVLAAARVPAPRGHAIS